MFVDEAYQRRIAAAASAVSPPGAAALLLLVCWKHAYGSLRQCPCRLWSQCVHTQLWLFVLCQPLLAFYNCILVSTGFHASFLGCSSLTTVMTFSLRVDQGEWRLVGASMSTVHVQFMNFNVHRCFMNHEGSEDMLIAIGNCPSKCPWKHIVLPLLQDRFDLICSVLERTDMPL